LTKRLEERDQEIGKLRQAAADRDALAAKVASLTEELNKAKERVAVMTGDLSSLREEEAKLKQERDQLAKERDKLAQERDQLAQEQKKLQDSLQREQERLQAEAAEKARLEQERAAKEAEIKRLTKTQEELNKALQEEIAKGNIKIKQIGDRLTINMVDKILFDSGQAKVKPEGLKVLKQVSDILKTVTDKQIRIEGHTDNVPIGVKLREKFPTNWELSTARATSVVRYLIEEGGVDRNNILAVGYADTRPVESNDTEEGKAANRRIEITLYPKDLSEIVKQVKQAS